MLCSICKKQLPSTESTPETLSSPLSRWRAHAKCLNGSFVFSPAPCSVNHIAKLACNLKINSFYPVTQWLSIGSRLKALGLTNIPVSKWNWEVLDGVENGEKQMERAKKQGLLNKRSFKDLVSNRERGFNLDLFDLVKTNYGLTHPSLLRVRKAGQLQPKSPLLEIDHTEVDDRIKGIHQWLEKVTQNYNYDTLPYQMLNYIKKPNQNAIFRPSFEENKQVMVAGQSKCFLI